MSRNGSGTYNVLNTFTAGTTITAASHNQNWADIGTEMTNSVAADGQTTMTGPLKLSNGTLASPALQFASDPDVGMYRSAVNTIALAVGPTGGFSVSPNGVSIGNGYYFYGGETLPPIGTVTDYAGTTEPFGWQFCDGASLLRTDFTLLFAVIGTTYGAVDGTHFTLPTVAATAPLPHKIIFAGVD